MRARLGAALSAWRGGAGGRASATLAVDGDDLVLLRPGAAGPWTELHRQALGAKAGEDPPPLIPRDLRAQIGPTLVLPDWWLGTYTQPFGSSRGKLIAAFIERRIGQIPALPAAAARWWGAAFYEHGDGERRLAVYHLQEAAAVDLLLGLEAAGVHPLFVTSPGLLWKRRLEATVPGFTAGARCVIHLAAGDCFLYFYFQGQFLFSRAIALPPLSGEGDEERELLAYEINQSLYLISQRVRAEVDQLYLCCDREGVSASLQARLGRPVQALGALAAGEGAAPQLSFLAPADLEAGPGLWALCERSLEHERVWRPIQRAGIAAGAAVCAALALELGFVAAWSEATLGDGAAALSEVAGARAQLRAWDEDLAALVAAGAHPQVARVLADLAGALPEGVVAVGLKVDAGDSPRLELRAVATAASVEGLSALLAQLAAGLGQRFGGQPLAVADVRLKGPWAQAPASLVAWELAVELPL